MVLSDRYRRIQEQFQYQEHLIKVQTQNVIYIYIIMIIDKLPIMIIGNSLYQGSKPICRKLSNWDQALKSYTSDYLVQNRLKKKRPLLFRVPLLVIALSISS